MVDVRWICPLNESDPMTSLPRLLPLALAVVIASTAGAQASATLPGWTITTNMTVDSGDAGRRSSMAMRQQVTERNLRWEFVQMSGFGAPGASSIEGMYTIIDSADSTMTTVMPAQHVATIASLEFLDAKKYAVSLGEQRLTRSDLEDLGDGGRILGHATHHYRLTTAGTAEMTVMGQTCTNRLDSVSEMWIAPDVDFGPASEAALRQFGITSPPAATGQAGVAPATMPKGTALRSVHRTTAPGADGKDVTVTMTVEIVELAHADLDAALFSVPAEIKKMDMRAMMANMPRDVLDSAAKAGAAAGAKAMCHSAGTR